jgi:hypothetical protein
MKTCSKCREAKPLNSFSKCRANRDGLQSRCKTCNSADNAGWHAKNPDKARAKFAKWTAENPDKMREHSAKWHAKNPDKARAKKARRRAAQLQATPPWADRSKIAAVYAEQQKYIDLGLDVHVDHIVPLRGVNVCGLHVHWNLRIILAEDNLRKRNHLTKN